MGKAKKINKNTFFILQFDYVINGEQGTVLRAA